MYKVYFLDGYEITGVLSVESTHSREIKTFNGLGQGYYAIPDNEDLKAWVIKCQQTDTGLFSVLDKLLQTKDESRLIVSSDTENFSEACYLEEYTKSEESAGVFDVTMKFIEHKPVGYRTSDIPNIPRPGKQPPQPKTVVFDGKKVTPANVIRKIQQEDDKKKNIPPLYKSAYSSDVHINPLTGFVDSGKLETKAPFWSNLTNGSNIMPTFFEEPTGNLVKNPAQLQNGVPYTIMITTVKDNPMREQAMLNWAIKQGPSKITNTKR